MKLIAGLICILALVTIAVQDFRSRTIAWWLLPPLLISLFLIGLTQTSIGIIFKHAAFNIAFIALQLFLLMLYFSIRERRFIRLIDTHIGLGDVLLLSCLCMGFSPMNFIVVLLCSLLLSLLATLAWRVIRPQTSPLIPLAGLLAIPIIVLVTFSSFSSLNLHNDAWISAIVESIS